MPRWWRSAKLHLLALCMAAAAYSAVAATASDASQQLIARRHLLTRTERLDAVAACRPWTVPQQERCGYVRQHCGDLAGNLLDFLELHFCELADRQWESVLLQLSWLALMFTIMLEACDRFFCPAIERISEWLKLSPTVAGATLLAFGNGATDMFTQIAMALSGKPRDESFEMALTEPLGTGMFVTHVVVAFIILVTPMRRVAVSRINFMKDCCFFLGAVAGLLALLVRGRIDRWQTVLPGLYYAMYIFVTILLGRGAEPLHADPRRHEIPHFRTTSYLDDVWVEKAAAELQAERQAKALALALEKQRQEEAEQQAEAFKKQLKTGGQGGAEQQAQGSKKQLKTGGLKSGADDKAVVTQTPAAAGEEQQQQLPGRGVETAVGGAKGEVHDVCVTVRPQAHACGCGDKERGGAAAAAAAPAGAPCCQGNPGDERSHACCSRALVGSLSPGSKPDWFRLGSLGRSSSMRPPRGLFDLIQGVWTGRLKVEKGGSSGSGSGSRHGGGSGAALLEPLLLQQQQQQHLQHPQQPLHGGDGGDRLALVAAHCDDMTSDPDSFVSNQTASYEPAGLQSTGCGRADTLVSAFAGAGQSDPEDGDGISASKRPRFADMRGAGARTGGLGLSDDEGSDDGLCTGAGGVQIKWGRLLRSPVTFMLSITMPLISNREGSGAKYRKTHAMLLPLVLPLLLTAYLWDFNPFTADWRHSRALQGALAICVSASLLVLIAYPHGGALRGPMLGVCTVAAFLGSMVWMRFAAEEVVAVTMAAGTIFDISSPVLAATFLSWAGAAGDTIANLSLARDGFPTMALTACFSSPLFVLLGGLTCTLVIFAGEGQGPILLPKEDELTVLYASCVVCSLVWVLATPILYKFKLTTKTATTAISMYLVFQVIYIYFAQT